MRFGGRDTDGVRAATLSAQPVTQAFLLGPCRAAQQPEQQLRPPWALRQAEGSFQSELPSCKIKVTT